MFKKWIFSSLVIIFGITGIVYWLTTDVQAQSSTYCKGQNKCVINDDGDLYFFTPNNSKSIYFNRTGSETYGLSVSASGNLYSNGLQVLLNSPNNQYSILSEGLWGHKNVGMIPNRDSQSYLIVDSPNDLGVEMGSFQSVVGLISTYLGGSYNTAAQLAFVKKDGGKDNSFSNHLQYRFYNQSTGWDEQWRTICDSSNNCNNPFLVQEQFTRGLVPVLDNDLLGYSSISIRDDKVIIGDGSSSELFVGKIFADRVDPVYTINQKRYATYMAGMVGLKEETTGTLMLKKQSSGLLMASLDFQNSPEGSNLWLFGQVVNLIKNQEHFDQTVCLLTPGFAGQVWYEKDINNRIINVFARPDNSKQDQAEISYRLTGPRFDQKPSDNYSDSDFEGLNLDELIP